MECPNTRRKVAAFCLLAAVLLAGCSYQDFRRSPVRNYAADLFYKVDRPIGEPAAAVDAEALAGALARWKQAYPAEEMPYTMGKRDLLRIIVHSAGGPESIASDVLVAEDGTVNLPLVGSVQVEGLSTKQIEAKLTELYADYYKNAAVNVYVTQYQSREFYVTGAVMRPGIVALARPRISLLEALLMAGGPSPDAGDKVVVTRGVAAGVPPPEAADAGAAGAAVPPSEPAPQPGQESVRVSLKELIELSDMSRNIWIGPDDVVHVQSGSPRTILVFGYVASPGIFTLPRGERLGLLDAVGLARGLTAHARSENSYLLRRTEHGREYYRVDLTRIASGEEPDTIVMPGDVLVVGTSWPIRALDGVLGSGRLIPMPSTAF